MATRKLEVVISGDASSLSRAFGKAGKDSESFGSKVGHVAGTALKGLAIGAGVAGVAVAVGMKKALDSAGEFQQQLSVLQAVTGATNVQMAAASKLAIKLGNDAKLPAVSAKTAATAMLELGKAGFTVTQSMKAARGTLLLATAANIGVEQSAKVVAQNIQAFGLKAHDTSMIVDQMAGVMNNTGVEFTAFADTLSYVGAISHTVGQHFDDTATQIAILSKAGIEGSMAGTGLRTMLAGLGTEGSKASKVFAKVGVDTVGANGQFIGMRAVIEKLAPALDKMTSSQRLAFMQSAFGKQGMNQANIVLGESIAKYDALKKAIDKKGQADSLAAAHMKGYAGAMAQLGSNLETLQITIGTKLLPVATRLAHWLSTLASAPNITVAVKILLNGIKTLALDAKKQISDALFGSARTITIGGEGRASRVVMGKGIIDQLKAFDWAKLIGGSSTTMVIGGEGRATRVSVSGGLAGSIQGAFQSALAKIDWSSVGQVVGAAISGSIVLTTAGFDKFGEIAMAWANSHSGDLAKIGVLIALKAINTMLDPSFWLAHWALIAGIVISVFPAGKFGTLSAKLAEAGFGLFGKALTPIVVRALEKLPVVMGDALASGAGALGRAIAEWGPRGIKAGIDLVGKIVDAIAGQFGKLGPIVKVLLNTGIVSVITGLATAAFNAAVGLATRIATGIKTVAAHLAGMAGDLATKLGSIVSQVAGQVYTDALSIGTKIKDGAIDGIKGLAGMIKAAAEREIKSGLSHLNPFSPVEHGGEIYIGKPIVDGAVIGINKASPGIHIALNSVIRSAITSAKQNAMSLAGTIGGMVGQGIDAGAASASSAIDTSPDGMALAALLKKISDTQIEEQRASLQGAIDSANAGTTDSTTGITTVDPQAVKDAKQAMDDWSMQQDADTRAAKLQAQKDAIQTAADTQKTAFAQGLNDLTENLNKGLITSDQYNVKLKSLLADSGQDYATIGAELGGSFADGFGGALASLIAQVRKIFNGPQAAGAGEGVSVIDPGAVAAKYQAALALSKSAQGHTIHFAKGGIAMPRPGGYTANFAEAGHPEAFIPLDSSRAKSMLSGGGGGDVYITVLGSVTSEGDLIEKVRQGLIQVGQRNGSALGRFA